MNDSSAKTSLEHLLCIRCYSGLFTFYFLHVTLFSPTRASQGISTSQGVGISMDIFSDIKIEDHREKNNLLKGIKWVSGGVDISIAVSVTSDSGLFLTFPNAF